MSKTILVVDDDRDFTNVLSTRLQGIGLNVRTAHNSLTAIEMVSSSRPDLICLDVEMPTGNGLSIREFLASDQSFANIPVIICTGKNDAATIAQCAESGARHIHKSTDLWQRLEPLVCEILERPGDTPQQSADHEDLPFVTYSAGANQANATPLSLEEAGTGVLDAIFSELGIDDALFDSTEPRDINSGPWVLHVDDDRDFTEVMKARLHPFGISVASVNDGRSGIRSAFSGDASAIILDYEMPNGQGDFVLGRLKENTITKNVPVIVLTGRKDRFLERRLIGMGASLFLNKPPNFDTLIAELKRLIDCASVSV